MTDESPGTVRERPSGIPQAQHFEITEEPLGPLPDGRFRVRNLYLSVDPAMRGWVSAVANYSEPVAIGAVMRSSPSAKWSRAVTRTTRRANISWACSAGSALPIPTEAT